MANKKRKYNILMQNKETKIVEGYPVDLHPDFKFFYYKFDDLFIVSEHSSGCIFTSGFRKKDAIKRAEEKLVTLSSEKITQIIEGIVANRNNGKKLNK